MRVSVVGLDKVRLPLSVQIASKKVSTTGIDIYSSVVDSINRGHAPFAEPELAARRRDVLESGHLQAVTDVASTDSNSEVLVIIVPLVVNDQGWRAGTTTIAVVGR